jgi:hypothetical protein
VGSPALAAYSLVLTALNARLVYHGAQRIKHESKNAVARALISLQQTPLELTKDERLLAFIPINDQWRREIVDRLNRRNAWSIATGSSAAWVVIAFVFTLTDSFISLQAFGGGSNGLAVGTLWLWLLCLVIGWLWVPTFTRGELKSAIGHANQKAAKKAAKRIRQKAGKVYSSARAKITGPRRIPIPGGPKKAAVDPLPGVREEDGNVEVESIQEVTISVGPLAEKKSNPVPHLTPYQSTASFRVPESQHDHEHLSVSTNPTANHSVASLPYSTAIHSIAAQSSIHPEKDRLLIPRDAFGSLNRDELRLAATFNYSRVMRYLVLVDDVLRALDKHTRGKDEVSPRENVNLEGYLTDSPQKRGTIYEVTTQPAENVVFPPGALMSMFNASIFALVLQCGTTVAAAIIIVFTPRIGLGCRSLGYIIYGGTSILILFLTIISTLFARISETRFGPSITFSVKGSTAFIAIALRRISLILAFLNATGLIILSCLQVSGILENCYCNASVLGHGVDSYFIISYEGWDCTSKRASMMRTARIVATVLAAATMAIYMFFLWLMSALPAEIDYS